ncbi:MAG: murein biosynthesis protein MurJ [Nonomuraea sp.]|nr:murein biosynthesis protein MurJ [Nonomuraea sp.]
MTQSAALKPAPGRDRGPLARATTVTFLLTIAGSASGFVRDLLVAGVFGATSSTDAFMVAWTIPETAAPLLIEGALSFLLIPYFSRAIEDGTPLRRAVWAVLPKALVALVLMTLATAAGAPLLAWALAPGISDHALAVQCMQVTALTVLGFGLAGVCSAALRTRRIFGPPAAIYLAYNAAIIVAILVGRGSLGIMSVAAGVAVGGMLMALIQVPSVIRHIGPPVWRGSVTPISWMVFAPIAAFTLIRQAQVFVERFVASSLPEGSISHLNYAQKIAQVPMVASLIVATVSFPALASSIAAGDKARAAKRVTDDITVAAALVLVASAFLNAHAEDVVGLLLQHGAFSAQDTAATAWAMRLYSLGLLGQAAVGTLCRVYFCAPRPAWYPAAAMGAGLLLNGVAAPLLVGPLGVGGVALANAMGITLSAVLLLTGLGGRVLELPAPALLLSMQRLVAAAAVATAVAVSVRPLISDLPLPALVPSGAAITVAAFAIATFATGSHRDLSSVLKRREGGA